MATGRPYLHVAAAAVAGTAAGAAIAAWWMQRQSADEITPLVTHPALKHGAPTTSTVRTFSDFVVEYDFSLRNPKWVLEHFTIETVRGKGTRNSASFAEDGGLDPRFRSTMAHFRGSGYDRGHMAPAANHKGSQRAMDDTFVLTNVSPQVGAGFNRDYWARFEKFVQDLVNSHNAVWVVTGPLFLPTPTAPDKSRWSMIYPVLGTPPRMMAVPTHFYKVVLAEDSMDREETTVFGAFVLPNAPINPETPLAAFTVPLSALEEAAGVNFFPKSLASTHRMVVDDMSLEWQGRGRSQLAQLQLSDHVQPLLLPALEGREQTPVTEPSNHRKPVELLTTREYVKGLNHVCERNGCKLPQERWWEGRKERPIRRSQTQILHSRVERNSIFYPILSWLYKQ